MRAAFALLSLLALTVAALAQPTPASGGEAAPCL